MVIGSTLCEGCNCCTDQGIAGCKEWHAADVLLVIGTRVKQGQVVHCVVSKETQTREAIQVWYHPAALTPGRQGTSSTST
jgi:hypothetical protein